jgi:4-oxalmesaconate hydratase
MIIDCHGHYTTEPNNLHAFRDRQLSALADSSRRPALANFSITDDEIRHSLEGAQLKIQRERGTDVTIFSPRAGGMAHHVGTEATSREWSRFCNDLIHRVCTLYPKNFVGVCQLPQSPGVAPANCIEELERCVNQLGFIGCNLNPDPSGGYWTDPPLTDRWWYPLYEKMVELDVPAMVHVSSSCNPNFHHTGAHYINGDTTAFMQFLTSKLFKDFPTLKFIIPHGGGAVPYH